MSIRNFYIAVLLGAIITIVLVAARPFIPRSITPVSDLSPIEYVYSSSTSGGGTTASLLKNDKLGMKCVNRPTKVNAEYCGFGYAFVPEGQLDGIDLSKFDELKLRVNYTGTASELKLYIHSFNQDLLEKDYADPIVVSSYMLHHRDLNTTIQANLDRFATAEWWLRQNKVSGQDAIPDFRKVVSIGIELPYQAEPSTHTVDIASLDLIGESISANQLYTWLFALWIAALSIACIYQLMQLHRRTRQDATKINMLARSNQALENESEKYRQLSYQDALTGLLNRGGFDEQKASLLASSSTNTYTLIIADLDHFKKVNDKYGHDVGDRVLCTVSDIIKLNTRNTDLVSRWGGEEFLILCPTASLEEAVKICEKISMKIAKFTLPNFPDLKITSSFGVGLANKSEEFSTAFKRVDEALYEAKQTGRNKIVIADANIQE